jgi:hypothetical protein
MKRSAFGLATILAIGLILPSASAAAPTTANVDTVAGLQVGVGTCSFATPRPATGAEQGRIFSAILAAAISQGVNLLGTAIKNAGAAHTWSINGSRNFEAATNNFPQCVQVARGRFYSIESTVGPWANSWTEQGRAALMHNGLFLSDAPEFFFEGEIVPSTDNSALTIRPVYSSFERPLGNRMFRLDRSRSIAVFLSITPPGTAADLEGAPAATIVLGEHVPHSARRYRERGTTYSTPLESNWFTITEADTRKPMTMNVMVSETQGANAFLSFIGSVLTDETVTSEATTRIREIVVPADRAAAAANAATAAVTAQNTADEKFGEAIAKTSDCADATENVLSAAVAARAALRAHMLADNALPANDPNRVNIIHQQDIDSIDLSTPSSVQEACRTIYRRLTGES